MKNVFTRKDDCYLCKHRQNVPGDAHIRCMNPDKEMVGNPHGVKNGWFDYPFLFDPLWKAKECSNFEQK